MNSTEHVIDVRGLRKVYGDYVAVDSLDLQVRHGEVFALLGPNGAGKTTTVEMLVGVRRRTAGTVTVLGEDPQRDRRRWRERIGVVPQTTGEYLDLTVREVVEHFATFYSNPFGVDELLAMVGLQSKAKVNSVSLSGGQRRRLDVAVGVVGRPDVVFLDEPTTGLDPVARREAWELVRMFRDQGTTTILTTHYLDEAETLADRAGIISAGQMKRVGTVEELGAAAGNQTHITFQTIGDAQLVLPADLAALEVSTDEPNTTSLQTADATEVLYRLIGWARDHGYDQLPRLKVYQPSLEDTYLSLIHAESSVDGPGSAPAAPAQAAA